MSTMSTTPNTYHLCGLIPVYQAAKREDYPLESATVHYDLSDVQLHANLTQTYTSYASVEAEIRYVFPLPPDASVCAFKAIIDGERTIKGVVKEKAKAKAEYDQAVSDGKTAALLEQDNVEIFQVSLGNIRPKQTIEVHISFVSVISHDGSLDSLRLAFPTAIAPRYGTPPREMFGGFGSNISNHNRSKDVLDFSVAVEMTSHIKSITSPSHPIALKLGESTVESSPEFDSKKARVSLSLPTGLEKDIVLVLSCQGLDKPRCMVESFSPEEGGQEYTDAYALTLVPRFELPPLPAQEYIFLVDRSGSMGGGKMNAVRSALQILLMSLPSRNTSFNLISFGRQHSSLWPTSVTYSADSMKAASAHVDTMTANFGGTEIRAAIEGAFASRVARPNSGTAATSVFVLTDGEAYDIDGVKSAINDAVRKAKAEGLLLRVFCMGIGNAVSKAMCDQIARAGQGTAVFVGEQEKPEHKLIGLLRAARGAVVEDISIDWGVGDHGAETDNQDFEIISSEEDSVKEAAPLSLFDESSTTYSEKTKTATGPHAFNVTLSPPPRIQQAPSTTSLPPLYPGFRTSIFAIVRRGYGGNTAPSKIVRVKGSVLGQPVVLEVPVSPISKSTTETPAQIKILHSLAARALIQNIEDRAANYMSEIDKAEVLRLAERYGLASSQTSFVAIDEQGKPVDVVPPSVQPAVPSVVLRMRSPYGGGGGSASGDLRTRSRTSGGRGGQGGPFGAARPPPGMGYFGALGAQMQMAAAPTPEAAAPMPQAMGSFGGIFGASRSAPPKAKLARIMGDSIFPQSMAPAASAKPMGQSHLDIRSSPTDSPHASPPSIEMFARAQSFDGSFTGSPSLFQILVQQSQAPATPPGLEVAAARKETVWCTLLCVAYLETKFAEDREVWSILVEKALRFVEDTLQDMGTRDVAEKFQEVKQAAKNCIA